MLKTYTSFFDMEMWVNVLSDPVSWGLIGTLMLLEGLLSADNALVLAVMVRHLPEEKRKKALFYGLLGAYTFRFIAIGLGVFLIQLWWAELLGALYLAWMAYSHFKPSHADEEQRSMNKKGLLIRMLGPFWGTVVAVELMDTAFSIDSVLAAFGVSREIWILLLGGMLGVLMMRTAAGIMIKIMDKIPELETTAYVLIAIISAKMMLGLLHIEIGHSAFLLILAAALAGTVLIHFLKKRVSFN
nr:DUF475 domain-containing protein [Domibacillus antri]